MDEAFQTSESGQEQSDNTLSLSLSLSLSACVAGERETDTETELIRKEGDSVGADEEVCHIITNMMYIQLLMEL